MKGKFWTIAVVTVVLGLLMACASPTPEVIKEEVVVEKQVPVTVEVEKQVIVEKVVTATPAPTPAPKVLERPLVNCVATETSTMDPHVCSVSWCLYAETGSYETLLDWEKQPDGTWRPGPWLAKSWEVSDDGLEYTFHLQEGIKFQDGTPFNAEAVKWNFERFGTLGLEPTGKLVHSRELKVQVLDEYTVKVILPAPSAPIIAQMTVNPMFISPTAAEAHKEEGDFGEHGDYGQAWLYDHAVGTGPYLLKEWKEGETLTLVKNPDYWRGWEGNHLESIILRPVPESVSRKLMITKGECDVIDQPDFSDLPDFEENPNTIVFKEHPGGRVLTIEIRPRGPFADKRVRKAMALAFDYEGMVDGILQGRAAFTRSPLIPSEFGYDDSLPVFERNLEKAKELMAEAGYPDGIPGKWEVWILPEFQWFQRSEGQLFQSNMKDIGINVDVVEWTDIGGWIAGVVVDNLDNEPTFQLWNWAGLTGDADTNLRLKYHSSKIPPNGTNTTHYNNPELDRILDEAVALTDPDERLKLYKEAQAILIEDQPAIWVAHQDRHWILSKEVRGFSMCPGQEGHIMTGTYYDMWLEAE